MHKILKNIHKNSQKLWKIRKNSLKMSENHFEIHENSKIHKKKT